MLASREIPNVREINIYLRFEGWTRHPPGPAGSLWTKRDDTVAVPEVDDQAVTLRLVSKLSKLLNRPQDRIAAEIKYYAFDMTDFRAVNDLLDDFDSIPLLTAQTVIAGVRSMLRSCGTTAFRNQADLKGHYSQYGSDVMNAARMAHTKQGSFIIPVLVRLPLDEIRPPDVADHQSALMEITSPPEPIERRVLRTLAQSLKAVNDAIVQPAIEPTVEHLHAAVEMGVSREMCMSLFDMLDQPIIRELDTTFQWAPAVEPSKSTPTQITIPAEARDLIQQAANKLKNNQIEPSRTLSGAIIALRHEPNTDVGFVTISTARNGRPAEVHHQTIL